MKTARAIVIGGCLGFLLIAIGGATNAWAKPFRYTISGTVLTTTVDTNGDGSPAGTTSAEGNSTLGPISLKGLSESVIDLQDPEDPTSFVLCALPDGSLGIQSTQIINSAVIQVRGKDLLTSELVEGTNCLSVSTCFDEMGQLQPGCIVSSTVRFEFTGGTGKFVGASGSYEIESITEGLVVSPTGNFSLIVSEAEGEIHVPPGN